MSPVAAPKVLLVIAHPVIASGIETLLKLEGTYEIKRALTLAEAAALHAWAADVALVDGTLLSGHSDARIGAPAFVLAGNERDGRALAHQLDDGRGWLRKDATGKELKDAIAAVTRDTQAKGEGLGTLGVVTIAALALVVLALVAYLIWMAMY
jgi:DNA-binding NarL/FixJ family response regulator